MSTFLFYFFVMALSLVSRVSCHSRLSLLPPPRAARPAPALPGAARRFVSAVSRLQTSEHRAIETFVCTLHGTALCSLESVDPLRSGQWRLCRSARSHTIKLHMSRTPPSDQGFRAHSAQSTEHTAHTQFDNDITNSQSDITKRKKKATVYNV